MDALSFNAIPQDRYSSCLRWDFFEMKFCVIANIILPDVDLTGDIYKLMKLMFIRLKIDYDFVAIESAIDES